MSFGFAVGDFLAVGNLCWKVYKKCKDAPGNYAELSGEVSYLYTVIKETEEMLSQQSLTAKQQAGLATCRQGCEDVLQNLNNLLIKYESLGTQSQRTFDRMGFGNQDMKDIRLRLVSNVSMLDAFNNAYDKSLFLYQRPLSYGFVKASNGRQNLAHAAVESAPFIPLTYDSTSHASLEKKLNILIEEVRAGKREGSVISVKTIDTVARNNKETWEELRKELEDVGISPDIINEKRQLIIAWFLEAVEAGKLEEDVLSEEDETAVSVLADNHGHVIEADDSLIRTSRSRSLNESEASHSEHLSFSSEDIESPVNLFETSANTERLEAASSSEVSAASRPKKEHEFTHGQPNTSHATVMQKRPQSRPKFWYLLGILQGKLTEQIEAKKNNRSFIQAVQARDVSMARHYIDVGADVDNAKKGGLTMLAYAALYDDMPMVLLLLEKGANVNKRSNEQWSTALIQAASLGSYAMVQLLLERGADVNMTDDMDIHALIAAAATPNNREIEKKKMVELLLSYGAEVNLQNVSGDTALYCAAYYEELLIVRLLLQNGASAKLGSHDRRTRGVIKKAEEELRNAGLLQEAPHPPKKGPRGQKS